MEEAYTYGNTITIKVTPDISAVNALSAEPNTVELIYNGKVITEATDEDGDGVYVLEYQTTEKELPIGTYQITISFGGDHNLNPQTWTGNITLNQKPVDAAIAGAITKPYDGDADITLNLNVTDLESGDSVTGTIAGTYDTQDVGDGKTIAISGEPNWTGDSQWYNITVPKTAHRLHHQEQRQHAGNNGEERRDGDKRLHLRRRHNHCCHTQTGQHAARQPGPACG